MFLEIEILVEVFDSKIDISNRIFRQKLKFWSNFLEKSKFSKKNVIFFEDRNFGEYRNFVNIELFIKDRNLSQELQLVENQISCKI